MVPLKIINLISTKFDHINEVSVYFDEPLSFDSKIVEHISVLTDTSKIELYTQKSSQIIKAIKNINPSKNTSIVVTDDGHYIRENTKVISNTISEFTDGIIEIFNSSIRYIPNNNRIRYVAKKLKHIKPDNRRIIITGRFYDGFHEPVSIITQKNKNINPVRLYVANTKIIEDITRDNIDTINTGFFLTNIIRVDSDYYVSYGKVENVRIKKQDNLTLILIDSDQKQYNKLVHSKKGLIVYDDNILSLYYNNLSPTNNIRIWIINNEPKFISISDIDYNWHSELIKTLHKILNVYNKII